MMIDPVITKGRTAKERADLFRKLFVDTRLDERVIQWLASVGFFTSPASTKYHGDYEGGLFDHSLNVVNCLQELVKKNVAAPFDLKDSCAVIGVLHDITKCGKYTKRDGVWVYQNKRKDFGGHGSDSLIKAQQLVTLSEEEAFCIRFHMGAYEKDEWNLFEQAMYMYHNVFWTHTADMMASKFLEV